MDLTDAEKEFYSYKTSDDFYTARSAKEQLKYEKPSILKFHEDKDRKEQVKFFIVMKQLMFNHFRKMMEILDMCLFPEPSFAHYIWDDDKIRFFEEFLLKTYYYRIEKFF